MKHNIIPLIFLGALCLFASCSDDGGGMANDPELPNLGTADTLFVDEGDSENVINFPISVSAVTDQTIILNFRVLSGTATAESDFKSIDDGQLVIPAGATSQNLEITIIGDQVTELDELFTIEFLEAANANIAKSSAIVVIEDDDIDNSNAGVLTIPTTGYQTPLEYDGMNLVWQDEFDAQQLDITQWTYELGDGCPNLCGWGNGELEYYRTQNTSIVEGNLVITAKRESVGGKSFTSSRLITKGAQAFKYGRVDIRARMPFGKGIWPALWMLGANIDDVGWPKCGEIDIMELVGGDATDNEVHGTIHWDNNSTYANFGGSYTLPSGDFADEYHVFSIVWDENKIVWLMDDIQYQEVDITPSALSEFQEEFFFIFNVAVGGNWPGSPNTATVFPQYMIVDYIRVFQPI